jgi:hypothetical protein
MRWNGEQVSRVHSWCRACMRLNARRRIGLQRRGSAYGPGGRGHRKTHCRQGHAFTAENTYVDPSGKHECRTCHRERRRTDPYREAQRFYRDAQRRAAGIPRRNLNRTTPRGPNEGLVLPAEPFARWLRANQPDISAEEWAVHLGCDETFIRRHIKGEYDHIHIDTADRILMAAGAHLNDLYPFEEPA